MCAPRQCAQEPQWGAHDSSGRERNEMSEFSTGIPEIDQRIEMNRGELMLVTLPPDISVIRFMAGLVSPFFPKHRGILLGEDGEVRSEIFRYEESMPDTVSFAIV